MKSEGTFQYTTLHGIVFNTSQITLTENERGRLRELHFGEAKNAHYQVSNKVVDVYDKMLAKNLPCVMKIGISQPLSRQQADTLIPSAPASPTLLRQPSVALLVRWAV